MSAIELQHVSYRYAVGGVGDVSFTVPQGEIACLLGASGSGKTTVLKLISGFLKPQSGTIRLGERIVAGDGGWVTPQQRRVGLVFQQHALFPHLTVAGNILFGCTEKNREKREAHLARLLEDFGITKHRDRYPHQISGGEQQRVALARAMAMEPEALLMDEPFSSLDKALREQVRGQCIERIRAGKLTALIVTHDEEEAGAIADRIIRLK